MRKVSAFLLLTVLLVSFTCSFLIFPIQPVKATTYLSETFETFPNSWTYGNGTYSIGRTAEQIHGGSYSWFVNTTTGSQYGYAYKACAISAMTFHVQEWIYIPSSAADFHVQIMSPAYAGGYIFRVALNKSGSTYTLTNDYPSLTFSQICTVSADTWHQIDAYMNRTSMKVHYYLDGVKQGTDWSTLNNQSTTNYWFGDTHATLFFGKFFIDDLAVDDAAEGTVSNPTYTNVAGSPTYPFGGNTLSFSTNWTAGEGSLDKYILSTNNTGSWVNQTAVAFSGGTWSNTTLTANATGDIQLGWRIYANNTSGGANNTGIQTLYIWKPVPPPSDHILGQSAGFTQAGGIYYAGAHHVIYTAYQNSSVSPWEYYVAGYDVNATAWYVADTGLNSSATDTHYNPSISVLPDGRLILLAGYYTPLKFAISTYDADTETNTSVLISSWSAFTNVNGVSIYSYPNPCHFSNRVVVFGRDGASYGGNITEVTWKANITESHYVHKLNASYGDWSHTGSTPYLDGSGTIFTTVAPEQQGWFNFTDLNGTAVSIEKVNLVLTSTMIGATCIVTLLSSGTMYNYTLSTGATVDSTFDVSAILNTPTLVANAKILITNTVASGITTVYYARLDVNYTGWTTFQTLFLPPAGFESSYWHYTYNSSGFIMGAGYAFSSVTTYSKNIYGMYSSDYGVTWLRMNETASQTLPYNLTGALLYETNQYSRCAAPMWDENNKIVIPYHMYESVYSQLDYQFKLGICSYNSTLGSATGLWSIANATDVYGNELTGNCEINTPLMLDSWYNRPTVWLAPDNLLKYVRLPNSVSQFLAVVNDTTEYGITHYVVSIFESQGYYSIFSQEAYINSFGDRTVGVDKLTLDDHLIVGTKFTPTRNCTLDWGMIWAEMNWTTDVDWQMGIYFASNMSLLSNSTKIPLTSGAGGTGWSIRTSFPLSSGATIYENVEYWLCVRYGQNGTTSILYNTDPDHTNYTFYKTNFPFSTSQFPSIIAPTGYYNWTLTMFATPSFLRVRGLGVMEFTDTGTNTTSRNVTCQFRTYVKNDNGLSYSYFHSNNTGSWLNTTYSTSLSGTASYVYFNVTTNDTTCVVLWEIWVNDSNNNWGHTATQTLALSGGPINTLGSVALAFSSNVLKSLTALIMRSSPLNFATDKMNSFAWAKSGNALLSFGTWLLNLFTNPFTSSASLSFSTVGGQGFQPSKIGATLIALESESERAYAVVSSYVSDLTFSSSGVKGLSNPFAGSSILDFVTNGFIVLGHGLSFVQTAILSFVTDVSRTLTASFSKSGSFSFDGLTDLNFLFGRVSTATFNFNTLGSIVKNLITTWSFNGQAVLSFVTGMLPSRLALPLGSSFGIGADDTFEILFGFCFVMLVVVFGYGLSRRENDEDF